MEASQFVGIVGDSLRVSELSLHQSSHQSILVDEGAMVELISRQKTQIHQPTQVQQDPADTVWVTVCGCECA